MLIFKYNNIGVLIISERIKVIQLKLGLNRYIVVWEINYYFVVVSNIGYIDLV